MEYYKGIFIRDYLKDQGEVPSAVVNPTCSPDIIPYQENLLTVDEAERTYDMSIALPIQQGMPNNIYVRAKNKADTSLTGKVRAYCAPLNVLYQPAKWSRLITLSGEDEVSFVCRDRSASGGVSQNIASGKVALTEKPFYLKEVKNPNQHHCLFALASNPDGSWLELESDFKNNEKLWKFLREHKQFANKNIVIVNPFSHTETQAVDFGNYDEVERKYNLIVKFTKGLETVEGARMLIQSADAACCFTKEYELKPDADSYSCEYTVPPRFFGSLNVSCIMPYPQQAECTYAVRNYLIEDKAHDSISYVAKIRHSLQQEEEDAERIGDYAMVLTQQKTKPGRAVLSQEDDELSNMTAEILESEVYTFAD